MAIGDKAIHMALDLTMPRKRMGERAKASRGARGGTAAGAFAEIQAVGGIASTQARFASPDATVLENLAVLLGPERASHADSFKIFDDAGAVEAFGSDWGVFPFAPLLGIYCAVTRMTPEGTPAGGWCPDGRTSVEAALRHYTRALQGRVETSEARMPELGPDERSLNSVPM